MGACVRCENMSFTLRVLVVAVALVAFSQSHDAVDEVVPEFGSPSYYDHLTELYDEEISLVQKTSSADKAAAAKKAEKESEEVEKKWTAEEDKAEKKAHELNKEQRKEAIKASNRSTKANSALASAEKAAHAAELAADESTAAAEKKSKAFQEKIKALEAQIAKESGAAKKASEKRLASYKEEMAKLAKGIADGKKEAEKIADATAEAAKKLKEDHEAINDDYKAATDKLADENKQNLAKLDAQQDKKAAEKADAEKREAAKKVLEAARGKEKDAKEAKSEKADKVYLAKKKIADVMQADADAKAAKEKAFKKKAADKLKAEEKASKLPAKEFPVCEGGQCLKDGKCETTDDVSGPFFCADLVSCCKTAPATKPYSGMTWAGIPPPPAPVAPKPSKKCLAEKAKCEADDKCAPLLKKDWVKSTKDAGCQKSKKLLDLWFAVTSECPYAKYPGFESNIPMWKQQIEDMPQYQDSGTTGRFKANKGAGSICDMVKVMVDGFASGFPDTATAPKASDVGGMSWEAPAGGWKPPPMPKAQD